MGPSGVLICDTQQRFLGTLADGFRQLGWDVHATCDDAEAGYRLLMWVDADQLPQIAILNLDNVDESLDFCRLLSQQEVLAQVQAIVFLDGTSDAAADFRQIGVIPLLESTDPWSQVKAVVDRLEEAQPSKDPAAQKLWAHQHVVLNHQHSEQTSSTPGRNSVASGKMP